MSLFSPFEFLSTLQSSVYHLIPESIIFRRQNWRLEHLWSSVRIPGAIELQHQGVELLRAVDDVQEALGRAHAMLSAPLPTAGGKRTDHPCDPWERIDWWQRGFFSQAVFYGQEAQGRRHQATSKKQQQTTCSNSGRILSNLDCVTPPVLWRGYSSVPIK